MKTVILPVKSIYTGSLILVNAQHPCQTGIEECQLVPVNSEDTKILLERRVALLLSNLTPVGAFCGSRDVALAVHCAYRFNPTFDRYTAPGR